MEPPSKKKRLSLASKNSMNNDDLLYANDDEAERMERRKSKIMPNSDGFLSPLKPATKVASKIADTRKENESAPSSGVLSSQARRALNGEQLTDLYANCIKLCSENKINTKNTWDLNLIDYIDDVMEAQQVDPDMMNFQAASVTLDASVKIYSCRVDSVHNEAFKVLGGLSRTAGGQDQEDEPPADGEAEGAGNEDQAGAEEGETIKKKTKKISEVGGVNTLGSNESITMKKFDLAFDVDPLFKKTSASFNEGGAHGLLLNHLNVHRNCELIFDSSDALVESAASFSDSSKNCNIADLKQKLRNITADFNKLEICPTFGNFAFSKQDDDEEDLESEAFDFEPFDDEDVPDMDPHEFENFGAIPGADIGAKAIEDVWNVAEANLMEEIMAHEGDEDVEIPQDLTSPSKKADAPQFVTDNEFAYFDPKLLGNWAGPDHWKFKKAANKTKDGEEVEAGDKKTKKKKEAFFIDFSAEEVDIRDAFAGPGKAATTLSNANLKKSSATSNLLPPDVHYDIKELSQLFTKPRWRISSTKRRKLNYMQEEEGTFQNGDGGGFDDDFGNDVDNDHQWGQDDVIIPAPVDENGAGLELVAEPRKVEQIKINYAKTSKFVDVKALKETIWTGLKDSGVEITRSGDKDDEESVSFSDILNGLPQKIPKEILPSISVPFCFICLLHLANEKGLSIDQEKNDLSQLFIHSEQE